MTTLVEKIVASGVDGRVLIPVLIALVPFAVGQAKDCIRVVRKVLREGERGTSN